MADLYLSAKQKTARARDLIDALAAEIDAFNAAKPWQRTVETDPEGLYQDHTVRLTRQLPEHFAGMVKDVAEVLLVALDQAAFAASKAAGSRRLMEVCFPIADDTAGLEKLMAEKCGGVPPVVAEAIRGLQPVKGGNGLIWGLRAIAGAEAYRLIQPMGSVDSGLTFINNDTAPQVRWNAKHKVIELGTFPIHGTFKREIEVRFTAAFAAIDGLDGCPTVPVLTAMAEEVERVIALLDGETSRLDLATE